MYDPDMARKARDDDEDYYRERAARIDAVMEIDRLALAKAIYAEGAYCGECAYEGWDDCSLCRHTARAYADAVINLGWRPRDSA